MYLPFLFVWDGKPIFMSFLEKAAFTVLSMLASVRADSTSSEETAWLFRSILAIFLLSLRLALISLCVMRCFASDLFPTSFNDENSYLGSILREMRNLSPDFSIHILKKLLWQLFASVRYTRQNNLFYYIWQDLKVGKFYAEIVCEVLSICVVIPAIIILSMYRYVWVYI